MGILDDLLQAIPEEKENDPATPPPAANAAAVEGDQDESGESGWYSEDFKKYANIS